MVLIVNTIEFDNLLTLSEDKDKKTTGESIQQETVFFSLSDVGEQMSNEKKTSSKPSLLSSLYSSVELLLFENTFSVIKLII